uniref:Carbohydrate kinase FGGY N-terminal domain-containing protein n=1 Tax=Meloidogyne incognita TaxID=6306 RepID=A0A914NM48_MELIC
MVLLGAIDQGTSSSRFLIFESDTGQLLASHQIEVRQQFPESGYVEMCPKEIFETTVACIAGACKELKTKHGIEPENIRAVGITNQRGDLGGEGLENEKVYEGICP